MRHCLLLALVVAVALLTSAAAVADGQGGAERQQAPSFDANDAVINGRVPGFELSGSWRPTSNEEISRGLLPLDYQGLPLTAEARARALNYSESQLGMIERQCEGWSTFYLFAGPFGLAVSSDVDALEGVVSYSIAAWEDRPETVIWMDGRPHPSKYSEHTRPGFTTGRWDGTTLVTTTTHLKANFLRTNGVPTSDGATLTMRFYRHGPFLTLLGVVEDPVYLAEPLVWTRNFELSVVPLSAVPPPCITAFEGTTGDEAPHYLWGRKPQGFMDEATKAYGIPREAVLGYPETLYPEFRQQMGKR